MTDIRTMLWCPSCEEERATSLVCECGTTCIEGPAIIWSPTGAGDYSGACSVCGQQRDEPHTWPECAAGMQSTINGFYGELGRAQAAPTELAHQWSEQLERLRALEARSNGSQHAQRRAGRAQQLSTCLMQLRKALAPPLPPTSHSDESTPQ